MSDQAPVPGLKIVSDGTRDGTRVLVEGKELHGVSNVEWRMNTRKRRATVILEMEDVELDSETHLPDEVASALRVLAAWSGHDER